MGPEIQTSRMQRLALESAALLRGVNFLPDPQPVISL